MWEAIVDTLINAGEVLNVYWPKLLASLVILIGGWGSGSPSWTSSQRRPGSRRSSRREA